MLSSPADVQVTVDNPANVLRPRAGAVLLRHRHLGVRHLGVPGDAADLRPGAGRPGVLLADLASPAGCRSSASPSLGSLLLLGIVWLGLGLDPVNIGGSIGVVLLAAACFTAIAHLLRTWLGVVGSAITLVLLMVQLTSVRRAVSGRDAAGTVPRHPHFHPDDVPGRRPADHLHRRPYAHLWRDVAVLAGFLIVAVGLCILVVHRRRRFRVQDLHPVLCDCKCSCCEAALGLPVFGLPGA